MKKQTEPVMYNINSTFILCFLSAYSKFGSQVSLVFQKKAIEKFICLFEKVQGIMQAHNLKRLRQNAKSLHHTASA